MDAPMAYGSSWARGRTGPAAEAYATAMQHQIRAASATYAAAWGNTRSLTH